MLSSLVKDHQAKQAIRKEEYGEIPFSKSSDSMNFRLPHNVVSINNFCFHS